MAYLKFSFSNWCVFWSSDSPRNNKENQILEIWHVKKFFTFTYKELKNIKSIEDLKKLLQLDIPDSEYEECLLAIGRWIKDVNEKFGCGEK